MGVAHGDEAVVELILVVAFDNKSVLDAFPAVNKRALRDNAYRETIDLADALILPEGISTLCQTLKVYAHVLLIGEIRNQPAINLLLWSADYYIFANRLFHVCVEECGNLIEGYLFEVVVEVAMIGIGNNQ